MALAWSPDGKILADASYHDPILRLWDGVARRPKAEWNVGKLSPAMLPLSWSADGKRLAITLQGKVKILHADSGKEQRSFDNFNSAAWSPVGETLAAFNGNYPNVQFLDAKTGAGGVKLLTQAVKGVAWSPDGKRLAVDCAGDAGQDGWHRITIWDAASGEEVRKLDGVCIRGYSEGHLVWSPDGKRIATGAAQTMQVWDAASGKSQGVIFPNPHFHELTVRPDGRYSGSPNVEEEIVMVVQKEDGTTETLPPAEFARKYKWKNEP